MQETFDKVEIMNIPFVNLNKKDLLHYHIFPRLNKKQRTFLVTANPEIVMEARENQAYGDIVKSADYIIPDGTGIIVAAKHLKKPLPERIPGYELMLDLLEFAETQGLSCYFLGAKEYVNEKTVLEAEKRFPNLIVAGHQHGFFDLEDETVADKVRNTNPDLIFVALGLPRQEEWIAKYKDNFPKGLFMGVGGSFDTFTGEVKRAPKAWIKMNLEWLYRLIQQPFRFKRILKVFEFIIRILLKK